MKGCNIVLYHPALNCKKYYPKSTTVPLERRIVWPKDDALLNS